MAEEALVLTPFICSIVVLLLAGAFLSMLKTALAVARKSRLRSLIEAGEKKYKSVLEAAEKPGRFLASLRMGIIFIEIAIGCLCAQSFSSALENVFVLMGFTTQAAFFLAVLVLALVIAAFFFIVCETLPRQIALVFPEALCATFFPLVRLCTFLVFPLLSLNRRISAFLNKRLSLARDSHVSHNIIRNSAQSESRRDITEAELRHALIEGEKTGAVESRERTMVEGILYLGNRPVSAFMTHRSEIRWLDINADSRESRNTAEDSANQFYIPVADCDLDEVIGMVSSLDIFKALMNDSWPGLQSIMRSPYFIPETISGLKAFEAFKNADANTLFVMDEYGGFAGILTLRSLIEEIVGELSASQREEEAIVKQADGSWLAGGGINIDDAASELGLLLPEDEHGSYHTLAGFILELAGEIPHTGDYFDYNGHRFMIVGMDGNRIDKILITKTS